MREPSGGAYFALEELAKQEVAAKFWPYHLDGYRYIELEVVRSIHLSHATFAEQRVSGVGVAFGEYRVHSTSHQSGRRRLLVVQ
jgi:hypothetical protein